MYKIDKVSEKNILLGFWIYILSDCILFSVLFAVYVLLSKNTIRYNMCLVNIETLILLLSSFIIGIVFLKFKKKQIVFNLFIVLLLGVLFVILEMKELINLINNGFTPKTSSFISAYLTLIGTHCIHIVVGIYWGICLLLNILFKGLTIKNKTSLLCLSIFWHFLHIIWVCIYTIVYLIGVL
ncbi:cytochrome c oxidase subunit 3 [Candidatus Portiera aleyrodidarum]|uniref:Heme transporter CcmD n=1 Tax=Candidatus Portiera aleyrodidarum MED (Bemisia tabaci) TaxID=1163752 RepID=A0AAU8RYH5_9GAMM|nr:cytochrome c oxidase subunit 3 [Candidatus Portiera aleyrodidarum]AFQ24098.1 heme/copper-type cytochrome/quinol oxidase, subunit 3 [Candidatus Portiera aleyrodidarum BT-B-HRs]AFS18861.1 Cytochrome o ubiquinol oxidase subunit 3 [Candidatus Portiera aleyrodidarum BT-QVLC]AFT80490.1 Cytochrome O ubiquinol oxidase subunit III [Candidatus Portiera aleyrodidarum BT-QVLC]AFT80770.1 Cytochrome O ubiquinol oxidase subunit III [Candidatus Portiera aleyrodidarum BT-B-HRs]AJF24073.1 heme transporter Cc